LIHEVPFKRTFSKASLTTSVNELAVTDIISSQVFWQIVLNSY